MTLLQNRRLLIVGVRNRRSLAYAIAKTAVDCGARVAFAVQPSDKPRDKTAALIQEDFAEAAVFPCNAGKDADVAAAVDGAASALGGLDGLVHAVAFADRETIVGPYHQGIGRASFAEAMDISAYTLTAFCRACLPHFEAAAGGSVVTLTYLGAERAMPNYNVMGIAKAALEASVRYLAYGMGTTAVRVNAVSAGPVKTLAAAGIGDFGKILHEVAEKSPLRRNISGDEVARAAVFLLSDFASAITGEVLHVDAGFHIT